MAKNAKRCPHTPQPWHARKTESFTVDGPDDKTIAYFRSSTRTDEENLANARLAIAAPDLLEVAEMAYVALSQLVAGVNVSEVSTRARIAQLKAAIAKACSGEED